MKAEMQRYEIRPEDPRKIQLVMEWPPYFFTDGIPNNTPLCWSLSGDENPYVPCPKK